MRLQIGADGVDNPKNTRYSCVYFNAKSGASQNGHDEWLIVGNSLTIASQMRNGIVLL